MTLDLSVYLVTDSRLAARAGHDLVDVVRSAVAGGVSAVQLREKAVSAREFLASVARVARVLPPEVALIVNDRVDVFLAARATGVRVAGVHVGQSDLPAEAVRRLIGDDAVLGVSASTEEQLAAIASGAGGVDYVGIGALHATATKDDAPPPLGHAAFARLAGAATVPAVAIGGVTHVDLPLLRASGGAGAAVVSAICSAADPEQAARRLRAVWEVAA